ncbi:MAG TPA: hypothetical protein VGK25_14285 [Ignavibacteria bacterium]|jgi:hypothetical protein
MAKAQSFADKLNKTKKVEMAIDPDTGKEVRILSIKIVESVKTEKGTWKFLEKMSKVYENSLKPYNP